MAHFEWFNVTRQPHKFNLVKKRNMKQGQTFEVVGVVKNANQPHLVLSFATDNGETHEVACVPFNKFLQCERLGKIISCVDGQCTIDEIEKWIKKVRGEKPFTLAVAIYGEIEHYIGF